MQHQEHPGSCTAVLVARPGPGLPRAVSIQDGGRLLPPALMVSAAVYERSHT